MQTLSQEQLRDVLARAEEIQQRSHADVDTSTLQAVLAAAEEAGLSREAVTQAVQERLGILGAPPAPGDLVFAKGNEGRYYAAEMVETRGSSIRVRFLSGAEHTVAMEDLRPLTLLPGERLSCPWPNWGFWTSTVISYDPKRQRVRMSDNWGSEHTFDLEEVYMTPPRDSAGLKNTAFGKLNWAAMVASGLIGGAIGSAITWFLTR